MEGARINPRGFVLLVLSKLKPSGGYLCKYGSYHLFNLVAVLTVYSQRAAEWRRHGGPAAGDRLLRWAAETQLSLWLSVWALQILHRRVQQQVSAYLDYYNELKLK